MKGRLRVRPRALAVLLATGATCLTADLQAQGLSDTQWLESLSLVADVFDDHLGMDPLAPENQSGQLSGAGWDLDGHITFGPPGPPSVTTAVHGTYQSGLPYLGGSAYVMISFEFRLNMITQPPVTITTVPLTVTSQGTADVSGDAQFLANAFAYLDLYTQFGPLLSFDASATSDPNDPDPDSDSFNSTMAFQVAPDETVFGSMSASAYIGAEVPQGPHTASAQAFIDPLITVADELIPGTLFNYRDVFDVEFGGGFTGGQTSVARKTWSQVKTIYQRDKGR